MYKRERERQKRDTRGLDLDLTSERLRSGFEGLPFAALGIIGISLQWLARCETDVVYWRWIGSVHPLSMFMSSPD